MLICLLSLCKNCECGYECNGCCNCNAAKGEVRLKSNVGYVTKLEMEKNEHEQKQNDKGHIESGKRGLF